MKLFLLLITGILISFFFKDLSKEDYLSSLFLGVSCIYLFSSGLETNFHNLNLTIKKSFKVFLPSFFIPFIAGICSYMTYIFFISHKEWQSNTAIFMGIAFAISALPVAIQIINNLKLDTSEAGKTVIATSTLCDLLALILFSFILTKENQGAWFKSHIAIFLFILGLFISFSTKTKGQQFKLFFKVFSQWVAPFFFIITGIKIGFSNLPNFTLVLIFFIFAISSKFLGSYLGAKWSGFSTIDSQIVAWLLNARGAIEISIASLALNQGIIDSELFSTLALLALFTSIIPTPLIKRLL